MSYFESTETITALNSVGENIFIADTDFNIVWINDYADKLIQQIGKYIRIQSKEELIGTNISKFHGKQGEKQKDILKNGPFPHETTINLFNRYTASIVVNPLNVNGVLKGYILTWKDITDYENELKKGQELIEELYTPVIDTTIDGLLLIPIIGTMTENRIYKMREKILSECASRYSEYVILDFTGMTELIDEHILSDFASLEKALRLLGVKVLYTGFSVHAVQTIVRNGYKFDAMTFSTFKQAVNYVVDKKGYVISPI